MVSIIAHGLLWCLALIINRNKLYSRQTPNTLSIVESLEYHRYDDNNYYSVRHAMKNGIL